MHFPRLRMTSQMGKIQIKQLPAIQEIRQPKAELSIRQPKAEVTMHTTPSKLTIDQTQAFEDMNLMNILRRTEKNAMEGQQAFIEGIGRRAEQGKQLMEIEKKGNPISSQAIANSEPADNGLGITFIPSHFSVKIDYAPAKLHMDVKTTQPEIQATPHPVEQVYKPGSVDMGMMQYPSLEIEVEGL
ncbi:DUF6470 family protein [Virgibacillus halophilus]|uniref:DUF6470 family protein n=1 Tax=Tigheibacillus halophilus TaxID=361280 RepID=A0ABU5C293_9BACI|nr:DUF6470 family protein [Virgibacillus halophilus]